MLVWMLAAFLVVFFVLAKFGFPAITNMVEKRKNFILNLKQHLTLKKQE